MAKGLAYMHTMPEAVVHRDIKSGNVMVMEDGKTGKIADVGESRRVDMNTTMTQIGTPLWAAPELLSGRRYDESVDVYSFGCVLFEIVVRHQPWDRELEASKAQLQKSGSGSTSIGSRARVAKDLMREIAKGKRQLRLGHRAECKHHDVGAAYKELFAECTAFNPRDRPFMFDVVSRLQDIATRRAVQPRKRRSGNLANVSRQHVHTVASTPWSEDSTVGMALESFASRLADAKEGSLVGDLTERVRETLGESAAGATDGVYNAARIHRFLRINHLDVADSLSMIVVNHNARVEHNVEAKRAQIVKDDLSFDRLPRVAEFCQHIPINPFAGRAQDGRNIFYQNYGSRCDFAVMRKVFTIEDYIEVGIWSSELYFLVLDAMSAVEGNEVASITFCSFQLLSRPRVTTL